MLAFSLGLVAHALIAVLARAFYARQDTLTPVLAAIGAVVVNTTLAAILIGPLGLPGIALAIAVAAWLEAAALLILLWRQVDGLRFGEVGSVAIRTVVASAAAGVVGLGVRQVVGGALLPDPVVGGLEVIPGLSVTIAAVGLAFGLVFVSASLALRITELRSIVGLMTQALRRPRRS